MISFYPGPGQVYKKIPKYVAEAYDLGILSINHRSDTFINLCADTQKILRANLNIPADYMIFFTSSATECWEIIAQSLPQLTSYHFYGGAFGEKWFRYTHKLKKKCIGYQFDHKKKPDFSKIDLNGEDGIICLTQNETSNGTQVTSEIIGSLRSEYPEHLIALDVTSSLGGIELPFEDGDIWYGSVQKCLGLPAGLGLMICSPKAIEAVLEANDSRHYNSMIYMREMMKDYQTPYTPNVLAIYLLKRSQEDNKNIRQINQKISKRAKNWYKFIDNLSYSTPLIKSKTVRSETVITCSAEPEIVKDIKKNAMEEGILIGNGYGSWKENTFRIANFPALKKKSIKHLQSFLTSYSSN